MNKVKFCFGIHNHQPVGNFGWVIEEAYQKSYLPFLQLLERYPRFRISLHFTGVLYEWIEANHPEMFDLMRRLIARNQIEILTGGMYEPILPAIPDRDKVGQIRMQTEYSQRHFGVTPVGMWLAERVWEPTLATHLAQAGVQYTILDDIHFRYSGLRADDLDGYYITEDQGNKVALFPIAKRLRYTIPFADPEETLAYLRELATPDGDRIAIYADDGEKFGVWPKTYEHCYRDGWLERFLSLIVANGDWIEMIIFGEALTQLPPRGRVYLPTASYSEMNEWAMPADSVERYDDFVQTLKGQELFELNESFVKGGFWRNFQTKYWESNLLHKRMLYVSGLFDDPQFEISDVTRDRARRMLYAGQCNCPYWHGVFGGLYLPHLRGANFQELIAAEAAIRSGGLPSPCEIGIRDFDCDGLDEIVVTTPTTKAIIAPARGGGIVEFDHLPAAKNLSDTLMRRREGYHRRLLSRDKNAVDTTKSIHDLVLVKEEGLENLLVEDKYPRGLFVDHFFRTSDQLDTFSNAKLEPPSFVDATYNWQIEEAPVGIGVRQWREAVTALDHGERRMKVDKRFDWENDGSTLRATYLLSNLAQQRAIGAFGAEFAFGSYPWPPNESTIRTARQSLALADPHELADSDALEIHSRLYDLTLRLHFDRPVDWWLHPIWTVSLSEGGFEKVFQGIVIVPRLRFDLAPGEELSFGLNLTVEYQTKSQLLKSSLLTKRS